MSIRSKISDKYLGVIVRPNVRQKNINVYEINNVDSEFPYDFAVQMEMTSYSIYVNTFFQLLDDLGNLHIPCPSSAHPFKCVLQNIGNILGSKRHPKPMVY